MYHESISIIKTNAKTHIIYLLPILTIVYMRFPLARLPCIIMNRILPDWCYLSNFHSVVFYTVCYRLVVLSLLLWHPVVSESFMKFSEQISFTFMFKVSRCSATLLEVEVVVKANSGGWMGCQKSWQIVC